MHEETKANAHTNLTRVGELDELLDSASKGKEDVQKQLSDLQKEHDRSEALLRDPMSLQSVKDHIANLTVKLEAAQNAAKAAEAKLLNKNSSLSAGGSSNKR
jgi:hypothetical protein